MENDTNNRFLILKNATIVTMNSKNEIIDGDILIDGSHIRAIGKFESSITNELDLKKRIVCPGFIQTHVHLCQTIFRGYADDLDLLDWLKAKIWPLEAAHTPKTVFLSALLGGMELLASGTTTIMTMETVNYTESVFEAVQQLGIRAFVGKCLMDEGDGVPTPLLEKKSKAIKKCIKYHKDWHGKLNGKLNFVLAPRFALACSENLFKEIGEFAKEKNILIHSHAAENLNEVRAVYDKTGYKNIEFFKHLDLPGHLLYLAHCIWVDDAELDTMKDEGYHVLHCPSSNLKLGSGIAMIPQMLKRGISVSIGADGAPCNNNLDIFTEMRLAALLQKIKVGAENFKAIDVLRMATIDGAKALGIDNIVGSIEPGKKADLAILNSEPLHIVPSPNLTDALVYCFRASDVEAVMIDGAFVYNNGTFDSTDKNEIILEIKNTLPALVKRAKKYTNIL